MLRREQLIDTCVFHRELALRGAAGHAAGE